MVRAQLGHDVAGAVEAVLVEHRGGDVGPLVVAGEQLLALDQQFAAGMRTVGVEVAQLGHVHQLVVDHRRAADLAVDEHRTGLGGAVALHQVHVQQFLHPAVQLGGDRRGTAHRGHEPSAEHGLTQFGERVGALARRPVEPALILVVQHLPDAGDEGELGGAGQCQVVEEGRKIAARSEIHGAAGRERAVEAAATHHMAHRHEAERDRGQHFLVGVPGGARGGPPHAGGLALRVHRALGGARAAGGVDQQCQRVGLVADRTRRTGQAAAAVQDIGQGLEGDIGTRELFARGVERLALVVDGGQVVEHHQPPGPVRRQRQFDSVGKEVDAGGNDHGFGLLDDGPQLGQRSAGL